MHHIDMEKETVKEKIVEFMRNKGGYKEET
jgi:hypothetical protein